MYCRNSWRPKSRSSTLKSFPVLKLLTPYFQWVFCNFSLLQSGQIHFKLTFVKLVLFYCIITTFRPWHEFWSSHFIQDWMVIMIVYVVGIFEFFPTKIFFLLKLQISLVLVFRVSFHEQTVDLLYTFEVYLRFIFCGWKALSL